MDFPVKGKQVRSPGELGEGGDADSEEDMRKHNG